MFKVMSKVINKHSKPKKPYRPPVDYRNKSAGVAWLERMIRDSERKDREKAR